MSNASGAPQGNPGDIVNWPMLKIHYRTDPECIAALLPPGIEPGAEPNVNLTFYNFPVPDEPEYGIVTTVNADYAGTAGEFTIGYGIGERIDARADGVRHTENVGQNHRLPVLGRLLGEPATGAKPGIGEHNIETAEGLDGLAERPTGPGQALSLAA